MNFKSAFKVVISLSLLWLITSCSSGSSSGGGSQTNGGSPPGPVTYSETDLEGTWKFNAVQVTSGETMTGTMTFNHSGQLIGFDSSRCPGQPIMGSEFWYLGDGWVKGRVYGFCSEPDVYIKFGEQYSNKQTLAGDMDLHYAFPGYDEIYFRYSITMTKPTQSTAAKLKR